MAGVQEAVEGRSLSEVGRSLTHQRVAGRCGSVMKMDALLDS